MDQKEKQKRSIVKILNPINESSSIEKLPIFMLSANKMDFVTLIEHGIIPPIAFKDRPSLDCWTTDNNLRQNSIGKRNIHKGIVYISGYIPMPYSTRGLVYNQIWVSINYLKYRDAIKFMLVKTEGGVKTVHLYDGDHAVSETRLAKIWPNAWINMILVERGINRSIGAMMEKEPLNIGVDKDHIAANIECMLKLLLTHNNKLDKSHIRNYIEEIRAEFITAPDLSQPIDANDADQISALIFYQMNIKEFFDGLRMQLDDG